MKLSIRNLTKKFGEVRAVDDLSVEVGNGEFFFFLGPSGCGKTTMLRMIAGFDKPTSGGIFFDDQDITYRAPNKRNIGMVFQNYALWPHMTVYKNVEYGLKMRDLKPDEMADRVSDVLKIVRMDGYEARSPNQLSGGQQQRIALARAIVIRPDILLLDEPLSNLDAKLRLEMRDEIKRIQNETAITTIYVTHDQKEALSMGNSIAVMKDGKIVQRDDPRVVHRSPADSFVASFIGETNFFHGKVVSLEEGKARVQLNDLEEAILVSKRIYEGLELGETVIISIRPECIHFEESVTPNEDYNKVMCTVEESTYLGELEQYSLRLKEHTDSIKSIHLNPFMIRKAGTKEKVYIHPNDVVLLKK